MGSRDNKQGLSSINRLIPQNMNTCIRIQSRTPTSVNGMESMTYDDTTKYQSGEDNDGEPIMAPYTYLCEWKNAYGQEALQAAIEKIPELGTLTMWYMPEVDQQCVVLKGGHELDTAEKQRAARYEIISVDDVENRHRLLVLKVQRAVNA